MTDTEQVRAQDVDLKRSTSGKGSFKIKETPQLPDLQSEFLSAETSTVPMKDNVIEYAHDVNIVWHRVWFSFFAFAVNLVVGNCSS